MSSAPYIIDSNKAVPLHYCPVCHNVTRPLALTVRQYEILKLLAQGLTLTAIGRRLFISVKTVESHVEAICRSAGIEQSNHKTNTAVMLTRWALREGLVE